MSLSVTLRGDHATGSQVSDRHFGINFVADFERIGSRPWERFDEVVINLGSTNVRYPGGVAAEQTFDYRNPNRSQIIASDGQLVNFSPLLSYIKYCNTNKIDPTIIIPTSPLLSETRLGNHRTFDANQTEDLKAFVRYVLNETDPSLNVSFELGNEYEGYMTSTEYGRVANSLVSIIDHAHQEHLLALNGSQEVQEPEIFVQSWGYSVGGGLTQDEIAARNLQVLGQFTSTNLSKIDGVVSHYYFQDGRNAGTDYEQTLERISSQVSSIARLHEAWEAASGRELISRVSEWNVSFRSETDLGLRQLQPLMEMFTSFLESGFDALDFWSAQYHGTSAAAASGRLMAAGTMLDLLQEYAVNTKVGESITTDELSIYNFVSQDRHVAVLTSVTDQQLRIDLAQSDLPIGFTLLGGYTIGVDESTADGSFKGLSGLPSYGEPDAAITVVEVPMSVVTGANQVLVLDPYEALVLVFGIADPVRTAVYGSNWAEWIYGTGAPSLYLGGGGWDVVNYITSSTGVDIRLDNGETVEVYLGDKFFSIEAIFGSPFADNIVGASGADLLRGGDGDDIVVGGRGNDSLYGGWDDDHLFGGVGSDLLDGEHGNDILSGGGGQDTLFGGDGIDTMSFDDFASGIVVWEEEGVVETEWGSVKFSEIENFIGSDHNDRFVLSGDGSTVFCGSGNDSVQARGVGYHTLYLGDGDDSAQVWSAQVDFYGGSGRDRLAATSQSGVFVGGEGDDRAIIFGGGWTLEGGEGSDVLTVTGRENRFVFSAEAGHDQIHGFNFGLDEIIFKGVNREDTMLVADAGGTLLIFSNESSAYFSNASISSLESFQWL